MNNRRLPASSLYIVIIIALFIATLCSALIVTAYYYRLGYQKVFRADRLQNNLGSAINLVLASDSNALERTVDLFDQNTDSVSIRKSPWGIFSVGVCTAFIQQDTITRAFTIANSIDTTKWAALYLTDEDRPLSVSGKTSITGNAYLPKAGLKKAYIDQKGYDGPERPVSGHIFTSQAILAPLNDQIIKILEARSDQSSGQFGDLPFNDTIENSFIDKTLYYHLGSGLSRLTSKQILGNIALYSDTTLIIDSTSHLNNVVVFARSIVVKDGFKGRCQLFARDSISIGSKCRFDYPSALGVIPRMEGDKQRTGQIRIGSGTSVSGAVFIFEKERQLMRSNISLAKNTLISGQVFCPGTISFQEQVSVHGNVTTGRFLLVREAVVYENHLVNAVINVKALSSYYLSSPLFNVTSHSKRILQWLN